MSASLGLLLMLAPAPVVVEDSLSINYKVDALAQSEVGSRYRFERPLYDDPVIQAEIRRIGLRNSCPVIRASSMEMTDEYAPKLKPVAAQILLFTVPADMWKDVRVLSMAAPPMLIYQARVMAALEEQSAVDIRTGRERLNRVVRAQLAGLPSGRGQAEPVGHSEISRMIGGRANWNMNNANDLNLACAMNAINLASRPAPPPDRPNPAPITKD